MYKDKSEWIEDVNKLSTELLGFDVITKNDDYGLSEVLEEVEINEKEPEEFINDYFHEELASIAYDEHMRKRSEHYEEDTDDW